MSRVTSIKWGTRMSSTVISVPLYNTDKFFWSFDSHSEVIHVCGSVLFFRTYVRRNEIRVYYTGCNKCLTISHVHRFLFRVFYYFEYYPPHRNHHPRSNWLFLCAFRLCLLKSSKFAGSITFGNVLIKVLLKFSTINLFGLLNFHYNLPY